MSARVLWATILLFTAPHVARADCPYDPTLLFSYPAANAVDVPTNAVFASIPGRWNRITCTRSC